MSKGTGILAFGWGPSVCPHLLEGQSQVPRRPQGQGHPQQPGLPPGWRSEEVDGNYLVQWSLTRASQWKLICHCSLASQGAPGPSKQMQRGNSILLQTRFPTKAAQWTKGLFRGDSDVRKERRERSRQGGQRVVGCVT